MSIFVSRVHVLLLLKIFTDLFHLTKRRPGRSVENLFVYLVSSRFLRLNLSVLYLLPESYSLSGSAHTHALLNLEDIHKDIYSCKRV